MGGGTRVFEAIKGSGWPAIILPGIHRGSDIDPRLKVFSHGMSPEKVGLAYGCISGARQLHRSDASSNTVTFAVLKGKIIGALDAPIFAPGLVQGPLDVEAIREVDSGEMTANEAFTRGGIFAKMGRSCLEECSRMRRTWLWRPWLCSRPWRWMPLSSYARSGRAKSRSVSGREPGRKAEKTRGRTPGQRGRSLDRSRRQKAAPGSQRTYSMSRRVFWDWKWTVRSFNRWGSLWSL